MKNIRDSWGLDREAVGVLWLNRNNGKIFMNPVVWVKEMDTCYNETSCGSGSIAVCLLEGKKVQVVQPSGEIISAEKRGGAIILSSGMEKILELNGGG